MRFFKNWLFVPVGLSVFLGFIFFASQLHGLPKVNTPGWSATGDPLTSMDHHNALICGVRVTEAPAVQNNAQVLVTFLGGMGGGQQLRLFPSSRGLCGELTMDHLNNTPVQAMLNPEDSLNYSGFTATYWEPTREPEPTPPYAWATVFLTERDEHWWIQFVFQSVNQPVTTVTLGVD